MEIFNVNKISSRNSSKRVLHTSTHFSPTFKGLGMQNEEFTFKSETRD
jgi:hypothetical protein